MVWVFYEHTVGAKKASVPYPFFFPLITLVPDFHRTKISRRCGQCEGCESQNCGQCTFCIHMPRFGGPGLKKKACTHRKCRHKVSALKLTQA